MFDRLIAIDGIQWSRLAALVMVCADGLFALCRRALRVVWHIDREYFPPSSAPAVGARRVPL